MRPSTNDGSYATRERGTLEHFEDLKPLHRRLLIDAVEDSGNHRTFIRRSCQQPIEPSNPMINASLSGHLMTALCEEAFKSRLRRRLQGGGGRRRHYEDDGLVAGAVENPIERRPCLSDAVGSDNYHRRVV